MNHQIYYDRLEAGKVLADELKRTAQSFDIILALPRGGVPVGYVISKALNIPLDLLLVRKIGLPNHEELAMGAVAMDYSTFLNQDIIKNSNITQNQIEQAIKLETQELLRRYQAYQGDKNFPSLNGKIVILVDDGIATGATMKVAIKALKKLTPAEIHLYVPVAPKDTIQALSHSVDDIFCPNQPDDFGAVGFWYHHFPQLEDDDVKHWVLKAKQNT